MRDLKNAQVGDRVIYRPLPADGEAAGETCEGKITSFSPSRDRAQVNWDDGEWGIVTDADYDRISLLKGDEQTYTIVARGRGGHELDRLTVHCQEEELAAHFGSWVGSLVVSPGDTFTIEEG